MKLLFIIYSLVLTGASSQAATFNCQLLINGNLKQEMEVQTKLNSKIRIVSTGDVTGYLVEKDHNLFVIESFLASSEVRIYAEATLKSAGEKLTSSLWSRDLLMDLTCTEAH